MKTKSNSCPWPARPGPERSARAISGPGSGSLYVYATTTTFSPTMRDSNHLDLGQRADAQHVHCHSHIHGGACKRNHLMTTTRSPGRRAVTSRRRRRYPPIDTGTSVWAGSEISRSHFSSRRVTLYFITRPQITHRQLILRLSNAPTCP